MGIKMIEGDDQVRVQKCGQKIQNILDQYDCALVPQLMIVAGQMQHGVSIAAKSREKPLTGKQLPQGVVLAK